MSHEYSARSLLNYGTAGLFILDRYGVVQAATAAATRIFGANVVGTSFADHFDGSGRDECAAFVGGLLFRDDGDGPASFSGSILRADKSPGWADVHGTNAMNDPGIRGLVLTVIDVSSMHRRMVELTRQSQYDSLTDLPNRALFTDRVRQAIRAGAAGTAGIADLDNFKTINDRFGHSVGDDTLREVGRRLRQALPESVTVARIGGDEFGLLFPNEPPEVARQAMERTLRDLAGTLHFSSIELPWPTMSVGLAALGGRGTEQTLQECDVAMYAAKMRGRNAVVIFDNEVRKFAGNRRELAATISALTQENAQLNRQVRTDILTTLLSPFVLSEIEAWVFGSPPCPWSKGGVAFLDLDYFHEFNRIYSDDAGDAALRKVGLAIHGSCRDSDLAIRKGGEEFVIVLPEVEFEDAVRAAERVRAAIAGPNIPHSGSEAGILTATVGVSYGSPGKSIALCVIEAANLVRDAKNAGQRNRVHVASR